MEKNIGFLLLEITVESSPASVLNFKIELNRFFLLLILCFLININRKLYRQCNFHGTASESIVRE